MALRRIHDACTATHVEAACLGPRSHRLHAADYAVASGSLGFVEGCIGAGDECFWRLRLVPQHQTCRTGLPCWDCFTKSLDDAGHRVVWFGVREQDGELLAAVACDESLSRIAIRQLMAACWSASPARWAHASLYCLKRSMSSISK